MKTFSIIAAGFLLGGLLAPHVGQVWAFVSMVAFWWTAAQLFPDTETRAN